MKGNMPKNSTGTLPTIPWHKKPSGKADSVAKALALETGTHIIGIAFQPPLSAGELDGGYYYFYCSCGACGTQFMLKTHALSEGDLHLEAVADEVA